jgi:uncharacterized protein
MTTDRILPQRATSAEATASWLSALQQRRRRGLLAGAALALVLAAAVLALTARIDMSFRPLFADDGEAAAATAAFEARFGQLSGAGIGAIIEHDGPLTPELLRRLARLSMELEALPHLSDVTSAGRMPALAWEAGVAAVHWIVQPLAVLHVPGVAEAVLDSLGAHPARAAQVIADDGRLLLVHGTIDLPLDDLAGRRRVISRVRGAVESAAPRGATVHMVGVSVVEAAYADAVLRSMMRSLALTIAAIVTVLLLLFRRPRLVVATLAGVAVATPVTLALLALGGRAVTLLNSMVPTIILVVGAADAIHMVLQWQRERRHGAAGAAAVNGMLRAMLLPCLLTTVTTALGFLALTSATVGAIGEFGINVALGVTLVFLANLLLVPLLLPDETSTLTADRAAGGAMAGTKGWNPLVRLVLRVAHRPWVTVAVTTALAALAAFGAARLQVDQRFNEELRPEHAVRVAQQTTERAFGGFLGPELALRRVDGGAVLEPAAWERLDALRAALLRMDGVDGVDGIHGLLPGHTTELQPAAALHAGLAALRHDSVIGERVRAVLDEAGTATALRVRVGDVGTRRALALADSAGALAESMLGIEWESAVVGQWYLAQLGMAALLGDMLRGFGVSALLVLPVLAAALRSRRLFAVALLPNLLPMLAALGFMGWAGITLRIGTALVLAVALAIAVDDSIHLLVRLRRAGAARAPMAGLRHALLESAPGLVFTTVVLAAGFLSMGFSDFAAIREMGLVAAFTIAAALATDLFVAPALFVLTAPRALQPRGAAGSAHDLDRRVAARRPYVRADQALVSAGTDRGHTEDEVVDRHVRHDQLRHVADVHRVLPVRAPRRAPEDAVADRAG